MSYRYPITRYSSAIQCNVIITPLTDRMQPKPTMPGKVKSMHIMLVVTGAEYGGAEQSLRNLVSSSKSDLQFTLVGPDCIALHELRKRLPDIQTLEIKQGRFRLATVWEYSKIYLRVRPDWVQITLCNPGVGMDAQLASILTFQRTVAIEQLVQPFGGPRRIFAKQTLSRMLVDHVAVGRRSARDVEYLAQLPAKSVRTIYNGVMANSGSPTNSVFKTLEKPVIGCIARLSPQKGLDQMLRALAGLPDVTLVLVGGGEELQSLQQLAQTLEIDSRVVFMGWQDNAEEFLAGFDVFVLPSNNEAFPLTLVEAMLARVPIVATNVGSVSEAIEHGVTGELLPDNEPNAIASAVQRLLADPDYCQTLTENAYERANALFTARAMALQYLEMWQSPRGRIGLSRTRFASRQSQA